MKNNPITDTQSKDYQAITTKLLKLKGEEEIPLYTAPEGPGGGYLLDETQVAAIQAAWLTGRPLLVRGDPGLGKSQLADALAAYLNWGLVSVSIHYNSQIDDLLYSVDHLERLHQANCQAYGQVAGSSAGPNPNQHNGSEPHDCQNNPSQNNLQSNPGQASENRSNPELALKHFIRPGKIWQAIAPNSLNGYACSPPHKKPGTLLLIDEIDKADASLPNALLEVLDRRQISCPHLSEPIQATGEPYMVIITSNDERLLPMPFIRRCAILDLSLPDRDSGGVEYLIKIYNTHVRYQSDTPLPRLNLAESMVKKIAELIFTQREGAGYAEQEYRPGPSEFLDMARALSACFAEEQEESPKKQEESAEKQEEILHSLAKHLIHKQQQPGNAS